MEKSWNFVMKMQVWMSLGLIFARSISIDKSGKCKRGGISTD